MIFPQLAQTKGVKQPKEHFWDVFDHSLETVAALERLLNFEKSTDEILDFVPYLKILAPHFEEEIGLFKRSSLTKLAALLHDIAKPKTKCIDKDGRTHFFGHAKEGAIIAGDILARLRFSGREIKIVQKMIEYHLRPGQMANEGLPTRRAIYRYFRDAGEVAIDTLLLGLADHLATRGPNLELGNWEEHANLVGYILSQKEESIVAPPKLIDGHDLIEHFDLKPSPQIGRLLEVVKEAQGAGEITTTEEALAFVQKQLEQR
jgi:poly(A) polymerase